MKQSHSIKREIDELEKRHEQLARELSKAIQANSEAQAELVKTGSDEAMRQAATAFASFSSLQEAVALIDRQLDEKRQQLAEAEEYEGQAAKRTRIAEIERELEVTDQEYVQERRRAHEALQEILPGVFAADKRHAALWRELRGLLPKNDNVKFTERIQLENLEPFGHVVDQALQVLMNLDSRPSKAERKAIALERNKRQREASQRREEEQKERQRKATEEVRRFVGVEIRSPLGMA